MLKDYVLLVNKPSFITSQDCLTIIKKKLKVKKIGHTGTLDPLATGLMIVLVNQATKISNFILALDKTYLATMQLFVKTDSGDISGKVLAQKPYFNIDDQTIERVFNHFNGLRYKQTVPIYSAVKKDGKKLYQYARKQQSVELPSREVVINSFKLLKYKDNLIEFEVNCSKGTYIRSLVEDVAAMFKTFATLVSLKRTHQNTFNISDALELDDITEKTVEQKALSIPSALANFMKLVTITDNKLLKNIKNGKQIELKNVKNEKLILLVDKDHNPLAIYQHHKDNFYLNKRGFQVDEKNKN